MIAILYAAQFLAPREAPGVERHARAFYSMLASLLLAILLFYEVSGGVLTMAWAVEALALLGAGFPLRDRLQRLSGLALFLACVLKLFLYDLRELETVNRILSFIVLGLILVGVSWMYTRFRGPHPALSLTLMGHRVDQIIDPVAVRQRGHRLRIDW